MHISNICCIFAADFKNNTKMRAKQQQPQATATQGTNAHTYVAYYRVSTRKQGLGLDAQQTTVQQYIANHGGVCIAEYSEKESGKGANIKNRTELWAALDACKKSGATLILAKLDRLARDVVFTMTICNSGVDIVFCDLPQVNTMILGIFATVAQYERELCSERTRKALAERKRQGVALGSTNGRSHKFDENDRANAHQARQTAAKENDNNRKAWHFVSMRYRRKGATMERIAQQLNAEHYATPSGKGSWRGNMVARLVARYAPKK